MIAASIRMKADVVRQDERESGLRMILNFGHTVGHALEQATRYKAMLHGEAVGWGMVAALMWRDSGNDHRRADGADGKADLSLRAAAELKVSAARVLAATGSDKKMWAG